MVSESEGVRETLRGEVQPIDLQDSVTDVNHAVVGGKDKHDTALDYRTKEYRDKLPKLEEHHQEILSKIQSGITKRVIHSELGISRATLDRYIADHEDLVDAWKDAQEDLLDLNEEVVSEIAMMDCSMIETDNGSFPRYDGRSLSSKLNAAKLRLERLGAKRGWNPKLETNEVGNARANGPIICVGSFSESDLVESKALVDKANEEAAKGLDGIVHG